MIDIAELTGKTILDVRKMVEDEQTKEYEIYVPKSTQQFFSESSAIAYDYAYAAYSGQLLANISDNFSYDQIPPDQHASIGFLIKTDNKELLAKTILDISFLYVNDNEDDDEPCLDFEDVNQYIEQVEANEIIPACPYLMELFFEFIQEEKTD